MFDLTTRMTGWKRALRTLVVAVAGLTLFIQFLPLFPRANPPELPERRMEAQLEVHPTVAAILNRSCRDCHSNTTRWPWYSRIAPVSWVIARDVAKARTVMNFSEWSDGGERKLEKAIGLLLASCADVTVGRMPKPEYTFLHSEAMMNTSARTEFCAWSSDQGSKLMAIQRRKRQKTSSVE